MIFAAARSTMMLTNCTPPTATITIPITATTTSVFGVPRTLVTAGLCPRRRPESASPRTGGARHAGSRSLSRAASAPEGYGQTAVETRPAEVGLRPNPRPGRW